ncbi:MAG: sodium/glutamate symporter [Fusobacteriaceae bacterium]|nr:sodium/glutamate symporter [Fusobacteriaceae bacterium]
MNVIKLGMFETLGISVIAIFFGDWLRVKFPVLKKYCLPSSVVGGTIFAIISLILYKAGIVELNYDYATANSLFYCIFFAASGASASLSLLKKGGKLVIIFAILAAVLAILQNVLALGVGKVMGVNPLIALMTGSIPMTGGHGNAASFAPIAVKAGYPAAMEVAIASATFGLISGSIIGGPFGNWMVKRNKLEDPEIDGKEDIAELAKAVGVPMKKPEVVKAVFLMCVALGIGQLIMNILLAVGIKQFPIHVCAMFAGILVRLYLDQKKNTAESLYESIDTVGDFSLGLFVSMSIVSMKLWQLSGLGLSMSVLLIAQVALIIPFAIFITYKLTGKNYDAAVIAVGHIGFGLGAVPVSMTTMQSVCKKYRYSKLAFFVVPVIGGFLSNITNAIIITNFLNIGKSMLGIG